MTHHSIEEVKLTMPEKIANIKKSESWQMFNEISVKYDFLNHFLSFGLDILWRRKLRDLLPKRGDLELLDLATGTGDVLITLIQNNRNIHQGIGMDLADKMLEIGRQKVSQKKLAHQISFIHGDANQIPFQDRKFDAATMAFGIRNVEDPNIVLKEIHRTLKTNGRALILEFSLPANKFLKIFHLFYLRHIVPLIGALFAGNYHAYKYLNETIEKFPYGDDFCRMMTNAGFQNVYANQLLFGVASIYQGDKKAAA